MVSSSEMSENMISVFFLRSIASGMGSHIHTQVDSSPSGDGSYGVLAMKHSPLPPRERKRR
jgi:hypothetical protein